MSFKPHKIVQVENQYFSIENSLYPVTDFYWLNKRKLKFEKTGAEKLKGGKSIANT